MTRRWPENTADIYRDIAEEERWLANAMWPEVVATWPDDQPGFLEEREAVKVRDEEQERS